MSGAPLPVAPGELFQRLDVRAGDERPPGAGDDDAANGGVGLRPGNGRVDAVGHFLAERIDGRVVDGDDGDVVVEAHW